MRVLLITTANLLPLTLTRVLNPATEYCAIVVDEPEVAKKILANVPPLRDIVRPLYELKECIENNYFDVAIWAFIWTDDWKIILKEFKKRGLPGNKLVSLVNIHTLYNFQVIRALNYYQKHSSEFDTFATGISETEQGLLPETFLPKRKLFSFARSSQDLYYGYQIAKFVLSSGGGGYIKYALIGLVPYSFHYDLSKSAELNFNFHQFFITFNDVHNFWLPKDQYRNLFNKNYLSAGFSTITSTITSISGSNNVRDFINYRKRLETRGIIDAWKDKNYPETVKENVQILDDYLTLCEENKVRPIMFLPPFTEGYKKYFSKQKLAEFYYHIRNIHKNHPTAIFFDGFKLNGFSDSDFYDAVHMNRQGAAKFSSILNNLIE